MFLHVRYDRNGVKKIVCSWRKRREIHIFHLNVLFMLAAEPIPIEVELKSSCSKKFNRQNSNYYASYMIQQLLCKELHGVEGTHTHKHWSVTDTSSRRAMYLNTNICSPINHRWCAECEWTAISYKCCYSDKITFKNCDSFVFNVPTFIVVICHYYHHHHPYPPPLPPKMRSFSLQPKFPQPFNKIWGAGVEWNECCAQALVLP